MSRFYAFDEGRFHGFKETRLHQRQVAVSPSSCDTLRCRAVYPLNGLEPFPEFMWGTSTIGYGDDQATVDAFTAATCEGSIFEYFGVAHPLEVGVCIWNHFDDNSIIRYAQANYSVTTFFVGLSSGGSGPVVGPGDFNGTYTWTLNRKVHQTSGGGINIWQPTFPSLESAFSKDYEHTVAVSAENPDVVDGSATTSIDDAGVVTLQDTGIWNQGSFGNTPPTFGYQIFWPYPTPIIQWVLTTPGASLTIDIAAGGLSASMSILVPHDLMVELCGVPPEDADTFYPDGFTVLNGITLSDVISEDQIVGQAGDLLTDFVLTGDPFTTDYSSFGLGGDGKLHRNKSYITWYDGPYDGTAVNQKIDEDTSWPAGAITASADRFYFGGDYFATHSTPTSGIVLSPFGDIYHAYTHGAMNLSASWAATNGARCCAHHVQEIMPFVGTNLNGNPFPQGTDSDAGHLDWITDDCDSSFPQTDGVSIIGPVDLEFDRGNAMLYRLCKGEPCCPVFITMTMPVNNQSYTAPVPFEVGVHATGHTIVRVEIWANTGSGFVKLGNATGGPIYLYSWTPAAATGAQVFARVIYDTTKQKDSAIAIIGVTF